MSSDFRFKQFDITHRHSTMKVGTDAVLLGAWTDITNVSSILDVGAGCGIISLMLAQRSNAVIHAVEIDPLAAKDASENFQRSPWANRLFLYSKSFRDFFGTSTDKIDLIVSNPPYFFNSLKSPVPQRNITRHNDSLSFEELLHGADKLLARQGMLSLILPAEGNENFIELAYQKGFFCLKKLSVRTKADKPVKRVLMAFLKERSETTVEELTMLDTAGSYSPGYRKLVSDFYLDF